MKRDWIIWSIEHKAWWAPNESGYRQKREAAGRYTYEEALRIVGGANAYQDNVPNEAMIFVGEVDIEKEVEGAFLHATMNAVDMTPIYYFRATREIPNGATLRWDTADKVLFLVPNKAANPENTG